MPPDFEKATCAEATWWAPAKIMPALGAHPVGHIRTCFPRKNGCPRQGSGECEGESEGRALRPM